MPTTAGTQVAEFVRVLALGWKNLAAYPPGHPALAGSLDLIFRRLNDLRGPGGDWGFYQERLVLCHRCTFGWHALSRMRRACEPAASGTPFGVPQSVPPNRFGLE